MSHRVAVLAGDGVGPEVVAEARKVVDALGLGVDWVELPWGSAFYHEHGRMMAEDWPEQLSGCKAVLLGAIGDPSVPDHVSLWGSILELRQRLDLWANLRPCRLLAGIPGPLAGRGPDDVEILFVPRMEERPVDMFATQSFSLAEEAIQRLLDAGALTKRPNITGGTTWGDKNKLALHAASGIPVDLFTATEDNWFNYLVCRTGPAQSNQRIAIAAHNLGWQWNPYGPGFIHRTSNEQRACHSEEAVFAFVGLPFLPPEDRR